MSIVLPQPSFLDTAAIYIILHVIRKLSGQGLRACIAPIISKSVIVKITQIDLPGESPKMMVNSVTSMNYKQRYATFVEDTRLRYRATKNVEWCEFHQG